MKWTKWIAAIAVIMMAGTSAQAAEAKVNEAAPDFTLTDTQGNSHNLSDFKGRYVVLEWINHGCPFVKKHYSKGHMQAFQKELADKEIVWLTICSSAKGEQGHMSSEDWNKKNAEIGAVPAAVLIDEDGSVGKKYGAKVTPHMYVINPEGVLIYQGAIDDKRSTESDDIANSENYVRSAVEQSMAGQAVAKQQTQPYGCTVKYK